MDRWSDSWNALQKVPFCVAEFDGTFHGPVPANDSWRVNLEKVKIESTGFQSESRENVQPSLKLEKTQQLGTKGTTKRRGPSGGEPGRELAVHPGELSRR